MHGRTKTEKTRRTVCERRRTRVYWKKKQEEREKMIVEWGKGRAKDIAECI